MLKTLQSDNQVYFHFADTGNLKEIDEIKYLIPFSCAKF